LQKGVVVAILPANEARFIHVVSTHVADWSKRRVMFSELQHKFDHEGCVDVFDVF
jgi:hypothetical protein